MNSHSHYWERVFKRVAFFLSVLISMFLDGNTVVSFFPPLFYFHLFIRIPSGSREIKFVKNDSESWTGKRKWRGVHSRVLLFQLIVGFAGGFRPLYDETVLTVVKIVVIFIAGVIMVWIDIGLASIFMRVRYYPWDFVLLAGWVSSFLILTLTDLYGYTILVWNIILELVLYPLYWIFEEDVC